tara:strand:+ start:89 stop:496 length:408 start_codon:yes stop_codon:yes gene_type:complete
MLSKLTLRSRISPTRGAASRRRFTYAQCNWYEDKTNYVNFTLQGSPGGRIGNDYSVLLYKVSSGRFTCRVWDNEGTLLATVTRTGGMANLVSGVNDNGVLGPIVTMSIIGTIDNATVFAGGINESDACPFNGGAG